MAVRQLTLLAAALIASAPTQAQESQIQSTVPTTMFYVRIPVGVTTAKERTLTYGLAFQGRRPYETVLVDSRMFNFAEGVLAGIEAKWLIAGGLAAAGGVYMSHRDKGRSDNYSGSQNKQQNSPPPPPPENCDPCKK